MDANLALEYVKVFLSTPSVVGAIVLVVLLTFRRQIAALIDRIRRLNWPGGSATFGREQGKVEEAAAGGSPAGTLPPNTSPVQLPQHITLSPQQAQEIAQLIRSERANAALWEYRYLNFYLVRSTQAVLDWLATLPQPVSERLVDSHLQAFVPDANERAAISSALQRHHLVVAADGAIRVTDKGREYIQWRGPL